MRKFTKLLMTLLLLCVAGVTNAQNWEEISPVVGWCHEYRDGSATQTDAEAQMVDGVYVVHVRSLEEAVANGFTDAQLVGWDSQFFIDFGEANKLSAGDQIRVSFSVKAEKTQTVGTQSHAAPGNYIHWYAIGDVNAADEWSDISKTVEAHAGHLNANNQMEYDWGAGAEGMWSIAFNLTPDKAADQTGNTFYFKDLKVEILKNKPATEITWVDLILNGDLEGEGTECFYVTEQGVGGPFLAKIYDGVGVDGSKGLMVQSGERVYLGKDDDGKDVWSGNDWDTQFFIRFPYILTEGTKFKVSFDYKADQTALGQTQAHANPGEYHHWACIGDVNFTTDWQSYEQIVTVDAAMAKGDNGNGNGVGMQTIAFNLAVTKTPTQYFFDNIKFEVDQEIVSSLQENPDPEPRPYPEPQPEDIEISPADGDIAAALAAAEEGKIVGDITINLTEGVTYTVGATLEAPASITINGNGATIDASALQAPFIAMANVEEPEGWTEVNVGIVGVNITGLQQALFYSTCKNYLIKNFTLENSVVEVAADVTLFDFTKGSAAVTFDVINSTLYAPTATSKSMYSSQQGQKVIDAGDYTQTFLFKNNTMYNLAKAKNFFSHRQSNQTWLIYNVENNIFVNCGKSGQTIKGMNGGQGGANPTWIIKGNIFNFEDADTSANEETGDAEEPVQDSVAGVVMFTDAANGEFSNVVALADGVEVPAFGVGDPRWSQVWQQTVAPVSSGEVLYALAEGDAFTSGQTVEVLNEETGAKADNVVATITYGEEVEGATEPAPDFAAAVADASVEGYTAYTAGNGVNGNKPGGTFYTIVPKYDGVISAAVVLNANKKFHLMVDGEPNATFEENTVTEKYYGTFEFNVKAGSTYKFYCDGSKLGFYGFDYTWGPEVEPVNEISIAEKAAIVGIATVSTDKQQGVYYNLQGVRVAQPTKGLYIINGKKVVVK